VRRPDRRGSDIELGVVVDSLDTDAPVQNRGGMVNDTGSSSLSLHIKGSPDSSERWVTSFWDQCVALTERQFKQRRGQRFTLPDLVGMPAEFVMSPTLMHSADTGSQHTSTVNIGPGLVR